MDAPLLILFHMFQTEWLSCGIWGRATLHTIMTLFPCRYTLTQVLACACGLVSIIQSWTLCIPKTRTISYKWQPFMHFLKVILDLSSTLQGPTSCVIVLMIISTCSMWTGLKLHQVREDSSLATLHIWHLWQCINRWSYRQMMLALKLYYWTGSTDHLRHL